MVRYTHVVFSQPLECGTAPEADSNERMNLKTKRDFASSCRNPRVVQSVDMSLLSHPTVAVHQKSLSPSHKDFNISPDTLLGGVRSCHPTGTCMRESCYEYTSKKFILTGSSSLKELKWSKSFGPKRATPTVG